MLTMFDDSLWTTPRSKCSTFFGGFWIIFQDLYR